MENSPRAMRTTPARQRARRSTFFRFAAQYPVATLVTAVRMARAPATGITGGRVDGSITSPKKKKMSRQKDRGAARQRNGRETEAARQTRQNRQSDDGGAEFDEQGRSAAWHANALGDRARVGPLRGV